MASKPGIRVLSLVLSALLAATPCAASVKGDGGAPPATITGTEDVMGPALAAGLLTALYALAHGRAATPKPTPAPEATATPAAGTTRPPRYAVAIVGTVSDALDRPVAGASIEFFVTRSPAPAGAAPRLQHTRATRAGRAVAQASPAGPYSQRRAYVETDVNGRYALALQLPEGTYQLAASAYGTAVERVAFAVSHPDQIVQNIVLRSDGAVPGPYITRAVHYVTERGGATAGGRLAFGQTPGAVAAFGTAEVSVPVATGTRAPRGFRLDGSTDPGHHTFVRGALAPAGSAAFFAALRKEVAASSSHAVLLFVHGYNQTFTQTVRCAGELRAGLALDAPVVVYDWPSNGDLLRYGSDETRASVSSPRFTAFVERLAHELPGTPIELVGHSMGNRLVARLIQGTGTSGGTAVPLSHVVMAAADVPTDEFLARLRYIPSSAGRFTVYVSSRDQALRASSVLHSGPRLGYFFRKPTVVDRMDTVDASSVDTSILGHSYFDEERSVLADMQRALANRPLPRDHTQRVPLQNLAYYKIVPP
ncbi:MAG TPA: alpha/beta hydrolase [Candidatus Elarobacter sp.]|jgi:esterase/lipase superfamily enzyme